MAVMAEEEKEPQPKADGQAEQKLYTEEDVSRRLRGQAKELEKLQDQLKEFDGLREKLAKERQKKAEEKGEWEKLYTEQKRAYEELEAKVATHQKTASAYEDLLAGELKSQVESLPDEVRKEANELIKDQPLLVQRKLIAALHVASGTKPQHHQPPKAPAPGKAKVQAVDDQQFASSKAVQNTALLDAYHRSKG